MCNWREYKRRRSDREQHFGVERVGVEEGDGLELCFPLAE